MSNQHHGIAQELEERRRLDDDQSILASDETQNSYWALLEAVPVPGGAPESGDEIMLEDAGAEQINQCLDTHEADPLAGTPATGMDIKVNLTQIAEQSATSHTPTLRRAIATRAAKKQWRQRSRKMAGKIRAGSAASRYYGERWIESLHGTGEGANKEETFKALADAFTLNNEVKDLLLKGPMENLQDFRYYFAEEEEI